MQRTALIPFGARRILSSALIDLGTSASRSGSRLSRRALPAASEARQWQEVGEPHFIAALFSLFSAATDHFHAFARLLRLEEPYAPSLASLLRSFCEVMGKAWWLLESSTPEQFAHRSAALQLSEHIEMTGAVIARFGVDGTREIIDDPIREAQQLLSRMQVPGTRERVPDFSRLVERLCRSAGVMGPDELYAELSAAAHGSTVALASFGHLTYGPDDDGRASISLGLSLQTTERYLDPMVRITETVLRRFAEAHQATNEIERLEQVVTRVDDTCRKVLIWVERGDPEQTI